MSEIKTTTEEKARGEHAAATTGAQAVADAVKRVADAAVESARTRSFDDGLDFVAVGHAGGIFELRAKTGPIFSDSGSAFLNGKQLETLEWGATYVRGKLSPDAKSGEVTVPLDEKTVRRGYLKL